MDNQRRPRVQVDMQTRRARIITNPDGGGAIIRIERVGNRKLRRHRREDLGRRIREAIRAWKADWKTDHESTDEGHHRRGHLKGNFCRSNAVRDVFRRDIDQLPAGIPEGISNARRPLLNEGNDNGIRLSPQKDLHPELSLAEAEKPQPGPSRDIVSRSSFASSRPYLKLRRVDDEESSKWKAVTKMTEKEQEDKPKRKDARRRRH